MYVYTNHLLYLTCVTVSGLWKLTLTAVKRATAHTWRSKPRFPAHFLQGGCRKAVLGVCTCCTLPSLAFRHLLSKENVVKLCLEFAQAAHSNASLSGTLPPHQGVCCKTVPGVCTSCTLSCLDFRHPYSKEDVVKQCLEFAQAAHSHVSLFGTLTPSRMS